MSCQLGYTMKEAGCVACPEGFFSKEGVCKQVDSGCFSPIPAATSSCPYTCPYDKYSFPGAKNCFEFQELKGFSFTKEKGNKSGISGITSNSISDCFSFCTKSVDEITKLSNCVGFEYVDNYCHFQFDNLGSISVSPKSSIFVPKPNPDTLVYHLVNGKKSENSLKCLIDAKKSVYAQVIFDEASNSCEVPKDEIQMKESSQFFISSSCSPNSIPDVSSPYDTSCISCALGEVASIGSKECFNLQVKEKKGMKTVKSVKVDAREIHEEISEVSPSSFRPLLTYTYRITLQNASFYCTSGPCLFRYAASFTFDGANQYFNTFIDRSTNTNYLLSPVPTSTNPVPTLFAYWSASSPATTLTFCSTAAGSCSAPYGYQSFSFGNQLIGNYQFKNNWFSKGLAFSYLPGHSSVLNVLFDKFIYYISPTTGLMVTDTDFLISKTTFVAY